MKIRGRASGNFPRTSALTLTKHKGEESPRSRCGDVVTRTRNINEYIFVLTPCSVLHLRIANILFKWSFELSSYFYLIPLVLLLFFTIIYYTQLALLWCWLQVFFQYCVINTSGLLYLLMVDITTINITFEWHCCNISLLPFHVLYQYFSQNP